MGELFKSISNSVARFVFAWLLPSVISLGLFWIFVLPDVNTTWLFARITQPAARNATTAGIIFVFLAITSTVTFAYASVPLYRLLEGYLFPRPLRNRLVKRHMRKLRRLQSLDRRYRTTGQLAHPLLLEQLQFYPRDATRVQATALGNALRAMEGQGLHMYSLDSQTMWYELLACAPDAIRRDVEETRSPVDFFVSSLAHLSVLAIACFVVAATSGDTLLVILGFAALGAAYGSYRMAINNVLDWSYATKALVNLGRIDLAKKIGLRMPSSILDERWMWVSYHRVVEQGNPGHNNRYRTRYDGFRL